MINKDSYMYKFEFNMEDYIQKAIKIIEYDQNLGKLRNKLVPLKI